MTAKLDFRLCGNDGKTGFLPPQERRIRASGIYNQMWSFRHRNTPFERPAEPHIRTSVAPRKSHVSTHYHHQASERCLSKSQAAFNKKNLRTSSLILLNIDYT
jgi:hypothetical protein